MKDKQDRALKVTRADLGDNPPLCSYCGEPLCEDRISILDHTVEGKPEPYHLTCMAREEWKKQGVDPGLLRLFDEETKGKKDA